MMDNSLKVGFIQTYLDNNISWGPENDITLNIKEDAENYIIQEIKKGFHSLFNMKSTPDIIIMPELTLPLGYRKFLMRLSVQINAVVLAGLDYMIEDEYKLYNRALLLVPDKWNSEQKSSISKKYYLGKHFPANVEGITIKKYNEKHDCCIKFTPEPNLFIIDAGRFGKIGFAICADFYDIERYVAYKGKVQHIFIIAYNKDTNSFFALAEAIARLVMCNVVICNTGKFGDSLVFSPYKKSYKRMIFRNQGAKMFSSQIINLPVKDLFDDQGNARKQLNTKIFKSPPGFGD